MKFLLPILLLLCCVAPSLRAQGGLTQLGEFRVNEFTTGGQGNSTIAADANGNFVIVW